MSETPFASLEGLLIGTVDFVAPNEIKVFLDINAPESVALNTGGVRPFPRVNGYVLISVDDAFLVAQIEWLTIERSAFPKRRGVRDFGVVDLPYPLRKMKVNPVGTLRKKNAQVKAPREEDDYTFTRGTDALPSVGSSVLLPTEKQLRAIVESGEQRRVYIGTSPLAANAKVFIDPDRLFGRHLAVLGNTGSGKSCSVAGLIRWSLEAAKKREAATNKKDSKKNEENKSNVNARFIIIDPNGEYTKAFSENSDLKARVFEVKSDKSNEDESHKNQALKVPLQFWNKTEWIAFTQATSKTQEPAIIQTLDEIKKRSNYLKNFRTNMLESLKLNSDFNKDYNSPFRSRVENLLTNDQIAKITDAPADMSLEQWLETYISNSDEEITILNLFLVPSEIIYIVIAVFARMVFEALQRYRKINDSTLPTVLVMEEAHTFIRRYKADSENLYTDNSVICCQTFERIAREGRKFGLGLVLSSQRPSELSQTVLSQCNTFLLHRMSNDRDQELVNRFVTDNLRGLLRELPTLPSQQAILLGWASELPVLTHMRDLLPEHRPHSEDPDFWSVWTGSDPNRESVWKDVAQNWSDHTSTNNEQTKE